MHFTACICTEHVTRYCRTWFSLVKRPAVWTHKNPFVGKTCDLCKL